MTPAEQIKAAAEKIRDGVEYRSKGVNRDDRDGYDLAVADWLDKVAERHVWVSGPTGGDDYYTACRACGYEPGDEETDYCPDVASALAVTRAYTGGAS